MNIPTDEQVHAYMLEKLEEAKSIRNNYASLAIHFFGGDETHTSYRATLGNTGYQGSGDNLTEAIQAAAEGIEGKTQAQILRERAHADLARADELEAMEGVQP